MKMKQYYGALKSRLWTWYNAPGTNRSAIWKQHCDSVSHDSTVKNLQVRLAWDAARLVTIPEERTEWIDACDASDAHFTSLAIAVCKDIGML